MLKKEGGLLVVIDEIQRCPGLLNDVHLQIESGRAIQFILTGSSARKLRRGGINLLGGRAFTLHLHPFTRQELGERFITDDAMKYGTLPPVALATAEAEKRRILKAYVETYLKEEIQQEALTRNVPAFARFLELAAFENGNILNFQNLASEVGIHSKTIKQYFQILEDTLIGFFLLPYAKSHRTKLVSHPKFFLFDCGIVTALKKQLAAALAPATPPYGSAFEHLVLLEMRRALDYHEREHTMTFFRTTDGAEVDIVLEIDGETWAIEIKSQAAPRMSDLRGLKSFLADHHYDRAICACQTPRAYCADQIDFLPWLELIGQL